VQPGRGTEPPTPTRAKVLEKSRAIPLLTLRACVAYIKSENLPTYIVKSFCRYGHICQSVRPHGTTRLPMDGIYEI